MPSVPRILAFLTLLCLAVAGRAEEPPKPIAPIERPVPAKGIDLPAEDAARLRRGADQLRSALDAFRGAAPAPTDTQLALLPDVEVHLKAVDFALLHGEFYAKGDIAGAEKVLAQGMARLEQLRAGKLDLAQRRGQVVRGYRSPIDGSVQPYGLVIPEKLDLSKPLPVYIFLHGRGDKATDLHFILQRQGGPGEIKPDHALVLHPFGRQCIGWKSAGELDVFDALAHLKTQYPVDEDRVVLMGFSMGGAGAWHIGAHHTDRFCAIAPGAGFADTRRFMKWKPEQYPPAYEQLLWTCYDVPEYVRNLFNNRVVAYSGEIDGQIQAAQLMEEAYAGEGRKLEHIIGPKTPHKYHAESLKQIMAILDGEVAKGRDRWPAQVSLQTRTLRYNRAYWVEALALGRHWDDSRVDAEILGPGRLRVTTRNVTELRLTPRTKPSSGRPAPPMPAGEVEIDGRKLAISDPVHGIDPTNFTVTLTRRDGEWTAHGMQGPVVNQAAPPREPLRKRPGLQGPIDDVVMGPFMIVRPSGKCQHPRVQRWVDFELEHCVARWRYIFRGEPRVKLDTEVTAWDQAHFNLVAFGDPASNRVIAAALPKLPVTWTAEGVGITGAPESFAAAGHVPLLVYPNPASPGKYLAINSGPTFREQADKNNSLQNPRLGDWAVIDLSVDPDGMWPGLVRAAGLFDESWRFDVKRMWVTK